MTELTSEQRKRMETARWLETTGRESLLESAEMVRSVARELSEEGWTGKDIADALGVSRQRVSQLLASRS